MTHAESFVGELKNAGFDFFTGVPCSLIKGVVAILEKEPTDRYVSAVREDAAFGFAGGAYIGGRRPAVLIQNSGLCVSINALCSLNLLYELPCLIVVTWRGYQGKDAPEHLLTGEITLPLLELIDIPYEVLDPERMRDQVRGLRDTMDRTRKPVALVVRPGILE